jgi:hypothetical protein
MRLPDREEFEKVIEKIRAEMGIREGPLPHWVLTDPRLRTPWREDPEQAEEARADAEAREAARPILQRLLTDPRMEKVWRYLGRRSRREIGGFASPAKFPPADMAPDLFDTAEMRQNYAMNLLFDMTFSAATWGPRPVLQSEVDRIRQEDLSIARQLNDRADLLDFEEHALGEEHTKSQALYEAAKVLEDLAAQRQTGWTVVQRNHGDLGAHGAALIIAEWCCMLFGSPLYGVTATLTSVALGCNVTDERVRNWFAAAKPGWKAPHPGDRE